MRTWNHVSKSGPATVVFVAGVLVLATGCVQHRTYVRPAYPVRVEAPAPVPPPPPPVTPPPPAVVVVPPPAPPAVPWYSAAVLSDMLAPIALYPDPLLAQILPAATLPAEVVEVNRHLREGWRVNWVEAQGWDNSVKALARYPATLRMMAENLTWTTQLGQAFLNQPGDVMNAVQRLRAQARALGNLRSTPEQTVVFHDGVIEILPAAPQVIYVPVYQPEIVYVRPPPAPGRFHISFGVGLVIGHWLNHDCDWHHHQVIVWHHERPRPNDWWHRPAHRRQTQEVAQNVTVVNNTTIINQNFTVWRPRTPGAAARPSAQVVRTSAPARNEPARPAAEELRQPPVTVQKVEPARNIQTTAPARSERPVPPAAPAREDARQTPVTVQKPAPSRVVRETAPAEVQKAPPVRAELRQPPVTTAAPQPAATPQPALQRDSRPSTVREVRPNPRAGRPTAVPKESEALAAPKAKTEPAATAAPRTAAPAPAGVSSNVPGASKPTVAVAGPPAKREPVARSRENQDVGTNKTAGARPAAVRSSRGNSAETGRPATRESR